MSRRAAVGTSLLTASAAGWLLVVASPSRAEACSPPPPPPQGEPCTRLRLMVPGPSFPQNLRDEIRLGLYEFHGSATGAADEFSLDSPPLVARRTEEGYADVSFQLVEEAELVSNARALRLGDPRPGDYIVSWEEPSSCATTDSPDGRGKLIGEFSITESAPVPQSLGDAAWAGQEIVSDTYNLGTDASCQPVVAEAEVARNRIEVALASDVQPWAATLNTALYADGTLLRGFAPVDPAAAESGTLSFRIDHICATDDSSLLDSHPNRLEEGRHEIRAVAQLGTNEFAKIASQPASFTIDCGDTGEESRDGGDSGSGGTARSGSGAGCAFWTGSPALTGGALALLVLGALRQPR